MLSLYIHIPFCRHKCNYCSFFVLPEDEGSLDKHAMETHKQRYLEQLRQEITQRKAQFPTQELRTLYIGGGTPFQLGSERIYDLVEHVQFTRGFDQLEELTIELNPDPLDEVLTFVRESGKRWNNLFRVRYSFGIQTLDDALLQQSGRQYSYQDIQDFLRELRTFKMPHQDFNCDLIAFGRGEMEGTLPRDEERRKFFQAFVRSHLADHFSIYTLELFPGSTRYYAQKQTPLPTGSPEEIMNEFTRYLRTLTNNGYQRYELSNFASGGHASIHNMVYWTGGSYIGCGINAASYINQQVWESGENLPPVLAEQRSQHTTGIRFHNTHNRKNYWDQDKIETKSIEPIDTTEKLYEELMMGLRLSQGIQSMQTFESMLVANRRELVSEYEQQGLLVFQDDSLRLTSTGKAVYNSILTSLTK